MLSILRLIWGLISRGWSAAFAVLGSLTTLLVAAGAARTVAVAAAITAFVLWMPMPTWLASVPSRVSAVPASVVFVMEYAKVAEGVAIVLSAYVVRFLARLVLKAIA